MPPEDCAFYVALIFAPLVPVFLYGMFTESVPIGNSRRKSYILLFSMFQTLVLLYPILNAGPSDVKKLVTIMTLNSFCFAVSSTVIDGMWVT